MQWADNYKLSFEAHVYHLSWIPSDQECRQIDFECRYTAWSVPNRMSSHQGAHKFYLLLFLMSLIFAFFSSLGHLVGPVLCHSFCNYMGFPALSSALEHPHRLTVLFFYVLGVLLFLLFLFPLTDPLFYGWPTPVCTLASSLGSVCS